MKASEIIKFISSGGFDERLAGLYGEDKLVRSRERYIRVLHGFIDLYGDAEDTSLYSVPGRTEISGNHTDHNNGRVLAASVNIDIIAAAAANNSRTVKIKSEDHSEDIVDIDDIEPGKVKKGKSLAIVTGMVYGFIKNGYNTGGFCAYTTNDVLSGSGLSSSASFEVMVGNIMNHMFNNAGISPIEIAKISKYAENEFFGKPCGLMDQTACAAGGFSYIDFKNESSPDVEKLELDISKHGYRLCIINTGGNHADLTEDYASVPAEMKSIAGYFNKKTLREIDFGLLMDSLNDLRTKFGDRSVLRAIHYFNENERVEKQREAIRANDMDGFLDYVLKSGDSSFKYLQNVYTVKNPEEQGISLALAICEGMGVYARVHGGGFAGTIQAYVKKDEVGQLIQVFDGLFGNGSCMVLDIRPEGAIKLI